MVYYLLMFCKTLHFQQELPSFIDIKFDEWVTMKIKLDPQRKSQLAYFPDIKDSSGVIKSFKMEPSLDLACSGSQSISALTINSSNWRSTNAGSH